MNVDLQTVRWLRRSWSELTTAELYALLQLRQHIFVVEQACPYLDADGLDSIAHHLLGYDGDRLCAYLRGFGPGVHKVDRVIGRVVVASTYRGQGLGHELMNRGRQVLSDTYGVGPIWLSAQAHLRPFYESLGYTQCGEGYLEDNIPHIPMRFLPAESTHDP